MRFFIAFILLTQIAVAEQDPRVQEMPPEQFAEILKLQTDGTYQSQCQRAYEFSKVPQRGPITVEGQAQFILVDKGDRLLHLVSGDGRLMKSYRMALGKNPTGHKRMEGDNKTPEGLYFVYVKNGRSEFHLSLKINYPRPFDVGSALKNGIKDPGKDIMIHGLPNSAFRRAFIKHPQQDWTRGCMAVTKSEIEEIWRRTNLGIWIEICP